MKWYAPPTWTNSIFLRRGSNSLNAALQQKNGLANIGQVIDFTYNVDFYVHIPEVHNYHDLGDYYLNQSGMVQMPEEWKGGIDLSTFGRNAAAQEKGAFTDRGKRRRVGTAV